MIHDFRMNDILLPNATSYAFHRYQEFKQLLINRRNILLEYKAGHSCRLSEIPGFGEQASKGSPSSLIIISMKMVMLYNINRGRGYKHENREDFIAPVKI